MSSLSLHLTFLTARAVHSSCERLDKEELHAALEDALHRAQEQHQKEVAELEQRLQASHQAEWDKVQQAYQEEAARCRSLQQQVRRFQNIPPSQLLLVSHRSDEKNVNDGLDPASIPP